MSEQDVVQRICSIEALASDLLLNKKVKKHYSGERAQQKEGAIREFTKLYWASAQESPYGVAG